MFLPFMVGGGLLGALMNKKDPLKGALMGGALGAATGGAGLFGGAPAATGGLGLTSGTGAGLASMGGGTGLTMGAAPGMAAMGGGTGLTAGSAATNAVLNAPNFAGGMLSPTAMEGVQKALTLSGLLQPQEQQQAQAVAPPQMSPAGTQSLVQLYEQGKNNSGAQSIAMREQERMQRKSTMWG